MPIERKEFRLSVAVIFSAILGALIVLPHVAFGYGYGQGYYYSQAYYYGQGYYQGSYNLTITDATTVTGNVVVTSNLGKGSGSFVIDHPLDPLNKLLYHSFVESPDAKNLYDGIVRLDANGEAVVILPSYFEALNKDFRYQLKPLGEPMPGLYIKSEVSGNRFTIGGGASNGRVSWQVTGTRHDAYIEANPIIVEVEKGPDQVINKGEYLFPEGFKNSFVDSVFGTVGSFLAGLLGR